MTVTRITVRTTLTIIAIRKKVVIDTRLQQQQSSHQNLKRHRDNLYDKGNTFPPSSSQGTYNDISSGNTSNQHGNTVTPSNNANSEYDIADDCDDDNANETDSYHGKEKSTGNGNGSGDASKYKNNQQQHA